MTLHVKQRGTQPRRSGTCPCGAKARPGQGNCKKCHAFEQKLHRAGKKAERDYEARQRLREIAEKHGPAKTGLAGGYVASENPNYGTEHEQVARHTRRTG